MTLTVVSYNFLSGGSHKRSGHRLVQHLRRGGDGSWSELAAEFGFYDQAHLARDIRRFTGVTPSSVKARATELSGLIP